MKIKVLNIIDYTISLVMSIIVALVIVNLNWLQLNQSSMYDVISYKEMIEGDYYSRNLSILANKEFLWANLMNFLYYKLDFSADEIVDIIIPFFNVFVASFFLLQYTKKNRLYVVYLFSYYFLLFFTTQLRMSFALSILLLLLLFFNKNSKYLWIIAFLLGFFHNSLFVLVPIIWGLFFIKDINISEKSKYFIIFIVAILFVAVNSVLLSYFANFISAGRADYYLKPSTDIDIGFFTFLVYFIFFLYSSNFYFKNKEKNFYFLVSLFVSMIGFLSFFVKGIYITRYICFFYIFLVANTYDEKNIIFKILFFAYIFLITIITLSLHDVVGYIF